MVKVNSSGKSCSNDPPSNLETSIIHLSGLDDPIQLHYKKNPGDNNNNNWTITSKDVKAGIIGTIAATNIRVGKTMKLIENKNDSDKHNYELDHYFHQGCSSNPNDHWYVDLFNPKLNTVSTHILNDPPPPKYYYLVASTSADPHWIAKDISQVGCLKPDDYRLVWKNKTYTDIDVKQDTLGSTSFGANCVFQYIKDPQYDLPFYELKVINTNTSPHPPPAWVKTRFQGDGSNVFLQKNVNYSVDQVLFVSRIDEDIPPCKKIVYISAYNKSGKKYDMNFNLNSRRIEAAPA